MNEWLGHVASAFTESDAGRMDTQALYREVASRAGLSPARLREVQPVGRNRTPRNLTKRAIRWHVQTLKHMGVVKRVEGERGVWELVEPTRKGLHVPRIPVKLVAFSTDLGVAIWGDNREVLAGLDEPVHLVLTSPPYPLRKPRAYGNPSLRDYVDFILRSIEPFMQTLATGASIVLNVSNDCFVTGSPARSTYVERLVIALEDQLGLQLMDRIPWINPCKPPGPMQWASKHRIHLNVGYEPLLWLSNDPAHVFADNRRVLEPHTDQHRKLIARGGVSRARVSSDGAYAKKQGAYGRHTPGRIPRNVLTRPHNCADARQYREHAKQLGLRSHGAVMPTSVCDFLIRYLTRPDQLVLDPWGGKATTGLAAERLGRRWMVVDRVLDYLRAGGECFRYLPGFDMPEAMETWPRRAA